jgi:hypothetical protein
MYKRWDSCSKDIQGQEVWQIKAQIYSTVAACLKLSCNHRKINEIAFTFARFLKSLFTTKHFYAK